MQIEKLFNGIAVIIDDQVGKEKEIDNLISQIEKRNMPVLIYKELPDSSIIEHLNGISFLLLDWKLKDMAESAIEGVRTPDTLSQDAIDQNISFLQKLREACFIPIFIFTNEDKGTVIDTLTAHGLYQEDKPNYIFVESKRELTGEAGLFGKIEDWIKENPSIYVLKAWEREYQQAKTMLFHDFYELSPNWPRILWNTFEADKVNPSVELGNVITQNLKTRMTPFAFEAQILDEVGQSSPEEIRKVLEGECFISYSSLHDESIGTGDIFKLDKKYYLNIRPDCDCIPRNKSDDVELYLLQGSQLTHTKEKQLFQDRYGNFEETDTNAIVFNIIDGRSYDFRFKNLSIKKWSEIKNGRIGRLLPPYITRIQQRYSLYLQRQGLPRIPKEVLRSQT